MQHQQIAPPPGAMPHFARDARFRRLVTLFDRDEIEAAVDCLIAYMDVQAGDADLEDDDRGAVLMLASGADLAFDEALPPPDGIVGDPGDAEDGNDDELTGDELGDVAWPERETQPGAISSGLASFENEDDEDDDSDRCAAGDDHMIAGPVASREWWNHGCREIGDEHDAEHTCH